MHWLNGQFLLEPPTVARINRANPFSHGLVAALPLNGSPYEAIYQAALNYEGAPYFGSSPSGPGFFTDGTDDGLWVQLPRTLSVPVTMLCVFCIDATSDVFANTAQTDIAASLVDEASAFEVMQIGITNNAGSSAIVTSVSYDDTTGSGAGAPGSTNIWTTAAGNDITIVGVFESTTSRLVYMNGALEGSDTGSRDPQVTRLFVGHGFNSSAADTFSTGVTKCVLVWDRALSAAEVAQISVNPWQVFERSDQLPRRFSPAKAETAFQQDAFQSDAFQIYGGSYGSPLTFKAAWARGSNVIIVPTTAPK